MSSQINILFIDDSRDDPELAVLKLQRAGVAVDYRRVATLAEVENTISDTAWDIILCDCKLPGFTALNVWTRLQELDVKVPFAVFADLVLNTEIRKLLDAGVHLFVDKNRLDEFEPTLRRFLRRAERDVKVITKRGDDR
ncbi:MAG: response regulator [Gammaproteobacteria bacterium]|nr:response regulator [Gammaproteobacteria bacterium]